MDVEYKKIKKVDFDKLKELFPDDELMWIKYRNQRLTQFDAKELDIYVIEYQNEYLGEITINYVSHALKEETIPKIRVYLEAFRIKKGYTNQGLGQKLLNYALNDLKKNGYSEFTIGVEENNEIAKHIYYKLGFVKEIAKGYGNEFDPCDYTLYLCDEKNKSM